MREEDRCIDHRHILHLDVRSDVIALFDVKSLDDQIIHKLRMRHPDPWLIDNRLQRRRITPERGEVRFVLF